MFQLRCGKLAVLAVIAASVVPCHTWPQDLALPRGQWLKLSPLPDGAASPRLGYEGDCRWDPFRRVLVRYGGHNQGGGGEQHSELWLFHLDTKRWELREPNLSPPGVCCEQQNVFDPRAARYLRFPSFSGSHGWQWFREIWLNDSAVWDYDAATNLWRNRRPLPAPELRPLRCAAWDAEHEVVVVFGGEGSREGTLVYDPYTNEWTRMRPPEEPEPRSGGSMAYDSERRRHLLFGSQFSDDPHLWAYDLRANRWQDLAPPALPPTDRNDAVIAFDPARGLLLALVIISEGKDDESRQHRVETWVYDGGVNAWRREDAQPGPDPAGNRTRNLLHAPELDAFLLENCPSKPREQQVWAYRPAAATRAPPFAPPAAPGLLADARGLRLRWDAAGEKVRGWRIYRGVGARPWEAKLEPAATLARELTEWRDESLPRGAAVFYALAALHGPSDSDGAERESSRSGLARSQPRVVEDLHVAACSTRRVELRWRASGEPDVAGWNVERAPVEVWSEDQLLRLKRKLAPLSEPSVGAIRRVGAFRRLNGALLTEPRHDDAEVDLAAAAAAGPKPLFERRWAAEDLDSGGKPCRFAVYAYRVRAVNAFGVEGGPSPAVLTIPAAPQWVFAREDGERCHLKWQAPEGSAIAGYRVYRMDGRWDKDPIQRLTPDPIAELAFTDSQAGSATRRYYVVAVDALGQEGHPSAPVWHRREWRAYYAPFVGEWHQ
jgi:hypothetical protein